MLDGEGSHAPEDHNEGRDRWLAMQTAYLEYRQASDALDRTRRSTGELSTGERLQMIVAEGRQRVAFERYLEARIGFLEYRFEETGRPDPDFPDPEHPAPRSWLSAKGRPALEILAVLLLCTTAFSLVREQKQVRELDAANNQLQAALRQTRDGLELLGQKLDSPARVLPPTVQQAKTTRVVPARRAPAPAPLRVAQSKPKPNPRVSQKQPADWLNSAIASLRQSLAAPKSYSFSISSFRQFTRVGPVEIYLRSVNTRQNTVNLHIVSGSLRLDLPHLRPNQPALLNVGDRQQHYQFVVDRIAGDRIEGRLVGRWPDMPELRASRIKSGTLLGDE